MSKKGISNAVKVQWGFHMTSYRANFASHHTCDCDVGFLLAWDGIWKCNKMFHNFLLSSCHIIKLQPSDRNISTHILLKFQILSYSKSEVQSLFVVFLLTALYKRKPRDVAELCTRMRVPRRANSLYDKREGERHAPLDYGITRANVKKKGCRPLITKACYKHLK